MFTQQTVTLYVNVKPLESEVKTQIHWGEEESTVRRPLVWERAVCLPRLILEVVSRHFLR